MLLVESLCWGGSQFPLQGTRFGRRNLLGPGGLHFITSLDARIGVQVIKSIRFDSPIVVERASLGNFNNCGVVDRGGTLDSSSNFLLGDCAWIINSREFDEFPTTRPSTRIQGWQVQAPFGAHYSISALHMFYHRQFTVWLSLLSLL